MIYIQKEIKISKIDAFIMYLHLLMYYVLYYGLKICNVYSNFMGNWL